MTTTRQPPTRRIRDWLENGGRPANLYELLGKPWFDLDRPQLAEAIRSAYGELLAYQNHHDRKIAARAIQLQKELGRAESILSDPKRLLAHHQEMVEYLRQKYEIASEEADAYWDAAEAENWLVEHQGIHPQAAAVVARALASPGKAVLEFVPQNVGDVSSDAGKEHDASRLGGRPERKPKSIVRRLIAAANSAVEVFGVSLSGGLFILFVMLLGAAIAITILAPWREVEAPKGQMPLSAPKLASPGGRMPEAQPQPKRPSAPEPAIEKETLIEPGRVKSFEGRLFRIRGHAGEIHLLLVDLSGFPNRMLEAFTGDYSFARELSDYRTDEEGATSRSGDSVVVEVVGLDPAQSAPKFRLCSWWKGAEVSWAELRWVSKKDDPGSRAAVGSRRPDMWFAAERKLSGLPELLRIHPAEGSTVQFIGNLDTGKSDPSQLMVRPREPRLDERTDYPRPDGTREVHRTCTAARLLLSPGAADAAVLQEARVVLVEAVAHAGADAEQLEMTAARWESLLSDAQIRAWQEAYSRPESCAGQEVQLLGTLDGPSSRGGSRAILVRPLVRTAPKDEPVEIAYSVAAGTAGLTSFERGAEILCGVRVLGGQPERPQLALIWAAKALDPQKRVSFAVPATR